jgi:hypothetical protein
MDLMNFNRLVKRYHIDVRELPVPTDEDVQQRTAARIVDALALAGRALPVDDFMDLGPTARKIATHELRDRIVAVLLKGHLAAVAGPADEDEDEDAEGVAPGAPRGDGGARPRSGSGGGGRRPRRGGGGRRR